METSVVFGNARRWLQAEGLVVLLAASALYHREGFGWGWFALGFMAPDLAMLAYLHGPRFGAAVYNAAHSYVAPVVLLLVSAVAAVDSGSRQVTAQAALIWFAHIGFCRATGFGLKYAHDFDVTHLGPVPFNLPRFLGGLLGARSRIRPPRR